MIKHFELGTIAYLCNVTADNSPCHQLYQTLSTQCHRSVEGWPLEKNQLELD